MKREGKRTSVFTRRTLLLAAGQVGLFGVLAAKLYQLQIVDGARYATLAKDNRISARLLAPPRGHIADRAGVVLAGNKQNWRALLIAEETGDVRATLDAFSAIVPLSDRERERIDKEVRQGRRFVPVTVRDFLSWDQMAAIEVHAPDLPGILVDIGLTRIYPFGPTLAHVIGYVAPPNQKEVADTPMLSLPGIRVGRAGMEKADEPELRGKAGEVQLEVNAVGRVIRELDREDGTPGEDLVLGLDSGLQDAVMNRIAGQQSASAVVMDVRNGEVLAMGSTPSFDPSLFNSGVSQAQWKAWTTDPLAPLINKAVAGQYAPGSTFKPVVGMAGLMSHSITANERFNCPGYIDIGNRRFHCWRKYGHGMLDLHGGLKNSCDVYFYNVALRTGIDRMAAMAKRFGIGMRLDIELPDAQPGFMPTREWSIAHGRPWTLGNTAVHGIGQGYTLATPLALATMTSRIATGRVVQPHLTRRLGGTMQAESGGDSFGTMGLSQRDLQIVRGGMWAVVNAPGGTAPQARLRLSGVQMAGKTGSAQVRSVSRYAREHGFRSDLLPWKYRPNALFIGFAPYDAPRYAVAVVVEHGNAGAEAAGPLARDIMTDTLTRDPSGQAAPSGQRVAERAS